MAELRAEGLTHAECAAVLGISRSYANSLELDPDGSADRVRKAAYGGTCAICGAATTGCNGRRRAPKLCGVCAPTAARYWTRERVVAALQEWGREYGHPPTAPQINAPGVDRRKYPCTTSVLGHHGVFDTWADAVEAAGYPRPSMGRYDRSAGGAEHRRRLRELHGSYLKPTVHSG